ncbi:MAG TPA: CHAT domain-containing protein [Bacteroidota bacterium]|nr:CHAT domain-containing protein [Bacteroidota bacterium]
MDYLRKISFNFFFLTSVSISLFPSTLFAQRSLADTAKAENIHSNAMNFYLEDKYDSALVLFRMAADIFRDVKKWERCAHCYNMIGDIYSRKFKLDSMEIALNHAREIELHFMKGDNLENALTFSLIGLLDIYREKLGIAIEHILRGKKIRERMLGQEHQSVAASYFLLALAYSNLGNYKLAFASCKRALHIYGKERKSDQFNQANTLALYGGLYVRINDYLLALKYFLQAIKLVGEDNSKYSEIIAYCEFNIGWIYEETGNFPRSFFYVTKAIKRYQDMFGEGNVLLASPYLQLGKIFNALGEYDKAMFFLEKSMSLEKEEVSENHPFIGTIQSQIAIAYANENNPNKAIRLSRDALFIYNRALGKNHPSLAFVHEDLGETFRKSGKFSMALRQFKTALSLRSRLKNLNDRNDIAKLYTEIASVYEEMKNYKQAFFYYNRALIILSKFPLQNLRLKGTTLRGLGDVFAHEKQFDSALFYYREAINTLRTNFSDTSVRLNFANVDGASCKEIIATLTAKADVLKKRYALERHSIKDLAAALSSYESAIDLLENLRKRYSSEEAKLLLGTENYSLYLKAIQTSLMMFARTGERSYAYAAFNFVERSKANALLDGIEDSEAKRFAGVPDSIIKKESDLRAEISQFEALVQQELDQKVVKKKTATRILQDKCFQLNMEREALSTSIEKNYPKYFELKYKKHFATVEEIQKSIPDSTYVIEYSLGKYEATIFLISKTTFNVKRINLPPNFVETVLDLYKAIKTVEGKEYIDKSLRVDSVLIQPIEKHLVNARQLLIIPDGALYYLPFEALISKPTVVSTNESINFSNLNYLVKNYSISYSYSASFYVDRLENKRYASGEKKSFAGFAPVFGGTDRTHRTSIEPTVFAEEDSSGLRSVTIDGQRFDELKYSEREVKSITKNFLQKGKYAVSFLRSDASEQNFKSYSDEFSCIHIATHGWINEMHPQLSMLLFSQPLDTNEHEDGILFASETYSLNLNADLVVLSCCESGLGKLVRGEGMMAMTRGFFYSGASNLIFSIWKVYDKQTDELMQEFYREVLEGRSFSAALRGAKLKMISDPKTAFPLKWGGFILFGN